MIVIIRNYQNIYINNVDLYDWLSLTLLVSRSARRGCPQPRAQYLWAVWLKIQPKLTTLTDNIGDHRLTKRMSTCGSITIR